MLFRYTVVIKIILRKLATAWNALCEHRISVLDVKASSDT